MEKKEEFLTKAKSKFNIKQIAVGSILLFSTLFNILIDYVNVGFDAKIWTNAAYWLQLVLTNGALVLIMLSVRSYMKEREMNTNVNIIAAQNDLDAVHCELSKRNLTTKFEDYVNTINKERKLKTYKNKLYLKIAKCKRDKKRQVLTKQLTNAEKEINYRRVRYNKIHISTIFSHVKLHMENDGDINDNEGVEIGMLLISKVLCIFGFGILGASFAFEPNAFVGSLLLNTFLKLFQTAYSVWAGGTAGQNFVRGTLLSKMQLRLSFVQKFIEIQKQISQKDENT